MTVKVLSLSLIISTEERISRLNTLLQILMQGASSSQFKSSNFVLFQPTYCQVSSILSLPFPRLCNICQRTGNGVKKPVAQLFLQLPDPTGSVHAYSLSHSQWQTVRAVLKHKLLVNNLCSTQYALLNCICLCNCLTCHMQPWAQACTRRYLSSTCMGVLMNEAFHSISMLFFFSSVGAGGAPFITLTLETLNKQILLLKATQQSLNFSRPEILLFTPRIRAEMGKSPLKKREIPKTFSSFSLALVQGELKSSWIYASVVSELLQE